MLGAYKAEEGEITLDGEVVKFNGTKDALEKGIVAVYQEFTLVPYISVAQNIFLNREYRTKLGLLDHKRMEAEAQELLQSLNCEYIDVKSYVKNLSVAEQQMVEIAKALSFKPRIMVFDEPTATLSERGRFSFCTDSQVEGRRNRYYLCVTQNAGISANRRQDYDSAGRCKN